MHDGRYDAMRACPPPLRRQQTPSPRRDKWTALSAPLSSSGCHARVMEWVDRFKTAFQGGNDS